jgi:hypothetical protein
MRTFAVIVVLLCDSASALTLVRGLHNIQCVRVK